MKKRLLSILFTLALCLALLSVTALAADPVNYDVTVNGVEVTSANAGDVLSDSNPGKVSYDADTNTLTIYGGLTNAGPPTATVIQGNGTTDVKIDGGGSTAAFGLTVTDAKDVTVTANSSSPVIYGSSSTGVGANITCSGDVEITNNGGGQVVVETLTVNGARNVTVTANSGSPAIYNTNITCSGNVKITNSMGGAVSGTLSVNGVGDKPAQNVTVTANDRSAYAITNGANINCSGNVEITNEGAHAVSGALTVNGAQNITVIANNGQAVSGTLTVNGAQNVTVSANSDRPAITNNVSITCSGEVEITNKGSGQVVLGTLTVNGAQNVTVSANSYNTAISQSATITCSGDVSITNSMGGAVYGPLTVLSAQDVTVTVNSGSPAIGFSFAEFGADITCSGDVEITNNGGGQAVGYTLIVHSAQDVKVTVNTFSCAINNGADINCSGNVEITNNSLRISASAVQGSLTVNRAQDVKVTVNSGQAVSQTLTVKDAQNVTVTANSISSAAANNASITCSGDVEIINKGGGKAVGYTLTFQQSNGHSYTVKTGSSLESLTIYEEAADGTFGPESFEAFETTVSAVKIESAGHTPGEWEHNRTQHWQVCTACGAELDRADHTFIGRTCTVCGYTKPASTYAITVESAKNGDVTSSHKTASKGTTVTLTVVPDKGCTLETLTVTDASGSEIELANKGDGKYTFTMPASKVTVKATFMEDNSMLNFFVDVFPSDYYYDAVLWAAENGVTGGVDDTHFAPNNPCTRAQSVTFLWRAAGCPAPQSSEMPFTDVAEGSYYYDAVLWAVENGITKGTSDSAFSPDAACSRGQIVTFLWRSQSSPAAAGENSFTDVAADSYCADAVLWAVENGITLGTGDGTTFSPNNDCTRAQIVTFLFRCLGGE